MRGTRAAWTMPATSPGIIPAYAGNTFIADVMHAGHGDHPRVCGEHMYWAYTRLPSVGSSPRMRGTLVPHEVRPGAVGIIPAYAGNTQWIPSRRIPNRDHPRVCGEHWYTVRLVSLFRGSSPRMRGTPNPINLNVNTFGIIPAYAGNTDRTRSKCSEYRDHPRVCGEHPYFAITRDDNKGSSPRMRGTQNPQSALFRRNGIIPAYAGNTHSRLKMLPAIRDHPRVCGEHWPLNLILTYPSGSSPRMRGTPVRRSRQYDEGRIIPAYAGNTLGGWSCSPSQEDHPRVCGEHRLMTGDPLYGTGSSPRMRGTRHCRPHPHHSFGIIPAYAGNTLRGGVAVVRGDHPRVCGEHADNSSMTFNSEGSSPRMRGTP